MHNRLIIKGKAAVRSLKAEKISLKICKNVLLFYYHIQCTGRRTNISRHGIHKIWSSSVRTCRWTIMKCLVLESHPARGIWTAAHLHLHRLITSLRQRVKSHSKAKLRFWTVPQFYHVKCWRLNLKMPHHTRGGSRLYSFEINPVEVSRHSALAALDWRRREAPTDAAPVCNYIRVTGFTECPPPHPQAD